MKNKETNQEIIKIYDDLSFRVKYYLYKNFKICRGHSSEAFHLFNLETGDLLHIKEPLTIHLSLNQLKRVIDEHKLFEYYRKVDQHD